jgi:uncharacterized membrane protein YfcA
LTTELLLFALVVLVAFVSGAMSGFGSVIISLTLAAALYPIEWMVPRLVLLNVFLNGYLVFAHRGHVAWRMLLVRLVPVMGLGAAVGVVVSSYLHGPLLKRGFGVLVVLLSAVELWRLYKRTTPKLGNAASHGFVFGAGVLHGIYATGGPMLVYALGRTKLDRTTFRTTLAMIWFVLNVALVVVFYANGRLHVAATIETAWLLPSVVLATVIGEYLHRRVDERNFRIVLFSLLFFAGGMLVV